MSRPALIDKMSRDYIDVEAAIYCVADPTYFLRLVECGALATRVINGRRVVHVDAVEPLTAQVDP